MGIRTNGHLVNQEKQSQFKPNTKPIQTQTNPTCSELAEPILEPKNAAVYEN
jgi:hypothetical protein